MIFFYNSAIYNIFIYSFTLQKKKKKQWCYVAPGLQPIHRLPSLPGSIPVSMPTVPRWPQSLQIDRTRRSLEKALLTSRHYYLFPGRKRKHTLRILLLPSSPSYVFSTNLMKWKEELLLPMRLSNKESTFALMTVSCCLLRRARKGTYSMTRPDL